MTMKILTLNKAKITNFAKERNKLLEKVKDSEWVLFLDDDERLNDELCITNYEYNAYYLKRKNYFLGQYVGTDKIIRLVKKGSGKWERLVHEIWISKTSHPAGVIKSPFIIHNTAVNLRDYIKKINNYSNLHAKENKKEGKNSNLFKIIFFPIAKFIFTLIKSKNIVFSIMQSLHSYLSWAKLYLRQY